MSPPNVVVFVAPVLGFNCKVAVPSSSTTAVGDLAVWRIGGEVDGRRAVGGADDREIRTSDAHALGRDCKLRSSVGGGVCQGQRALADDGSAAIAIRAAKSQRGRAGFNQRDRVCPVIDDVIEDRRNVLVDPGIELSRRAPAGL